MVGGVYRYCTSITINLDTNTPAPSLPQIWQDHQNTVVNQMQCMIQFKVYKFQLLQILTTCTSIRVHAYGAIDNLYQKSTCFSKTIICHPILLLALNLQPVFH